MKITKILASLTMAGILLCGTNLSTFAAENEDKREVDDTFKTCYEQDLIMSINENEDVYTVSSIGGRIRWEAEKVDESMYTARNSFARKSSPNTNDKDELCISAGTAIHRVGISENGWDIIEYDGKKYFMWYNNITDIKPVVETKKVETTETPTYIPTEAAAAQTEAEEAAPAASSDGSYVGTFQLTAYTWTGNPCADGVYPSSGYTVACNDGRLWHHWIYIEGYGTYYVHDTGGMASNVIDIYMDSYDACIQFGRRSANIYIVD